MDKQLHTQFIKHPFTIDPNSLTYIHLLERTHMDSFLPNALNLSTLSSHTTPFRLTPHTNSPALILAAPHPHAMPLTINLHNKVKVKSLPSASDVEFRPQSEHFALCTMFEDTVPNP